MKPVILKIDEQLDVFLGLVEDLVDEINGHQAFDDGMDASLAHRVDDVDKGLVEIRRALVREQAARAR